METVSALLIILSSTGTTTTNPHLLKLTFMELTFLSAKRSMWLISDHVSTTRPSIRRNPNPGC